MNAPHPLLGARIATLLECFREYGWPDPRVRFWIRALSLLMVDAIRTPLHHLEQRRVRERVHAQEFVAPPIFIIGHWRSGTTHLHQLLSRDPQFGVVTLMEAACPLDFLTTYRQGRWMTPFLPRTRLVDAVPVSLNSPWEEEMAMACFGPLSFFHTFFFPREARRIYRAAVHFRGVSQEQVENWWRDYTYFLRKVQCAKAERRLLIKNPANSARVSELRRRFPGAKFIHIHRNPEEVVASTVLLHRKLREIWALQDHDLMRLQMLVLENYRDLMQACLEQTRGLAAGELIEIRLADLEAEPIPTLAAIYRQLDLPGFAAAAPHFEQYLEGLGAFRKNQLNLTEHEREELRSTVPQIYQQLGYAR